MITHIFTAVAPVNIAVIKYWGKKDEKLILPINDSVSITLSKKEMYAKTTVACSEHFECDQMWLNGKEQDIRAPRLQNCITELKKRARNLKILNLHLHICSENNFPTAAGLASSAAGFACLVKALSTLYDVEGDLSQIARQGSGSASRSMYGGFVQWLTGTQADGSDSVAQQIAPREHWPEMRALILVVNADKKEIGSTKGMQQSVLTSSLLHYRVSNIVPGRVEAIKTAILQKDFQTFAEITMKLIAACHCVASFINEKNTIIFWKKTWESNQFHAICLDTFPPIQYMNSTSFKIIHLVHVFNEFYGENKVAYTFDAGPNACLYLLEKDVAEVISIIKTVFPPSNNNVEFVKGLDAPDVSISQVLLDSLQITSEKGGIQYIISTQIGSGPAIIQEMDEHLLNEKGLPLSK